eukprot:c46434_g1_i1.p1 GENE.c46434_g1_i1~~c46434_g1_i1.p1  ORF type:complete len:301 (+),score=57.07 c46434_g1_i1:29-904(+)
MKRLEDCGALVIKSRDFGNLSLVVPRVNLSYLYRQSEFSIPRDVRLRVLKSGAKEVTQPAPLGYLIPALLHNIFVELSQATQEAANAFEHVMLWIELVRVWALREEVEIPLSSVLPGMIFEPWDSEELLIAPWLLTQHILPTKTGNTRVPADQLTRELIQMAVGSSQCVVSVTQGSGVSKGIEYCARHVVASRSADVIPVVLLSSMKLRERQSMPIVASLANEIHQLAAAAELSQGSYYAIIYSCLNETAVGAVPKGTIVVPFETLETTMRPFGASCLLTQARNKRGPNPE